MCWQLKHRLASHGSLPDICRECGDWPAGATSIFYGVCHWCCNDNRALIPFDDLDGTDFRRFLMHKTIRQALGHEDEPSWMKWAGALCIVLFCAILMIAGGQ